MNLAIYDGIKAAVGVKKELSYCSIVDVGTFVYRSLRIPKVIVDHVLYGKR